MARADDALYLAKVPVAAAWSSTESSPRSEHPDKPARSRPALPTTFTSPCRLSRAMSDQADRRCGECPGPHVLLRGSGTLGLGGAPTAYRLVQHSLSEPDAGRVASTHSSSL